MSAPSRPLNLCIIENGLVPEDLRDEFPSYPAMIERWLRPALPEARFTHVSPVQGEPLPAPEAFDGYLLTGSRHSAYEKAPWMLELITFLQQLREQGRPVFGICFGHQIMADAYGGRTAKAEQGWGVGAQPYRYVDTDLQDGAALIFHQDQVVDLPAEAWVVGGSEHCPNGALAYRFPALSVQYHPEFSPAYVAALARRYGGERIPAELAEQALASLETLCVDNARVARWAADFFRQHAPAVAG